MIVYLHVRSYVGSPTVTWAKHYWGDLRVSQKHGGRTVEVTQTLNLAQARLKNEEERNNPTLDVDPDDYESAWHCGDRAPFFWSEESLIRRARQIWREAFPAGQLLLLGEPILLGPLRAVDGPEPLLTELNGIVDQLEAAGEDGFDQADRLWTAALRRARIDAPGV